MGECISLIGKRVLKSIGASILMCGLTCSLSGPSLAAGDVSRLSTLEWPPYTGKDLPSGGATTKVVSAAFEKAGYQIEVEYRPWKRAINMASEGTDRVVAYYPGYHCRHQDGFVASEPIGSGPLGFAEHVDAPMTWETLDDIADQNLKIGTVLGYANTSEFDANVAAGDIQAIPSYDDLGNLRKLSRKLIDAVVIDKLVLEYLKATEASLEDGREGLRFNAKPLADKTLYLCFRGDSEGRKLVQIFNAGLAQIDVEAIVDDYFATAFPR